MMQSWDPKRYQQAGCFVSTLGEPLVDLLDPYPGMRILDVGCGDGKLTRKLLERGAHVLGIDASPAMVSAAQATGIDAQLLDVHDMPFNAEFDAAFSNAALHWMTDDPAKIVQNIFLALKPGGRFVAEFGGEGNIAVIRDAMQQALNTYGFSLAAISPKFFPSVETYQTMLIKAGFNIVDIACFERPTPLPEGLSGWLQVFAAGVLDALPVDARTAFIQDIERFAQPRLKNENGWWGDYVRLRVIAIKPGGQ